MQIVFLAWLLFLYFLTKILSKDSEIGRQIQPYGHWTAHDQKNVRNFFDNYARSRDGDPYDPVFWYGVKKKDFAIAKVWGGRVRRGEGSTKL
jgi:hypothetical protein